MHVKLTVPMSGEKPWNVGDEFECSADEAKRLIDAGYAVPIVSAKIEKAVKKPAAETREG